jgi:hypothetical protein
MGINPRMVTNKGPILDKWCLSGFKADLTLRSLLLEFESGGRVSVACSR